MRSLTTHHSPLTTHHSAPFMFSPGQKPTRLGQCDGRRHSTRLGAPVLTRLCQRPVLLRVAVVLVTAAVVAVLVYAWGPAVPHRVGEVHHNDLRVRGAAR